MKEISELIAARKNNAQADEMLGFSLDGFPPRKEDVSFYFASTCYNPVFEHFHHFNMD